MSEWIVDADFKEDIIEGWFTIGREIVRCKDCKWFRTYYDGSHDCEWLVDQCFSTVELAMYDPEDYCSHGERKS